MTSPEQARDMHRVFEDCDPIYLRQLREAAGMDTMALARTACLSVAQVRYLEGDGDGVFYSPSIKRQAYKRLLMILGAEPPMATPEEALQAAHHGLDKASQSPIDRIVALSEHTQPMQPALTGWAAWLPLGMTRWHKVFGWCVFGALVCAGAYMLQEFALVTWTSRTIPGWSERTSSAVTSTMPQVEVQMPVVSASEPEFAPTASSRTETSSSSESMAPMPLANPSSGCAYSTDALPELSVAEAHKVGNYVYVASEVPMTVCVVDGARQVTTLELKPGEGRSVYGTSPWQITSAKLYQAQIYFQGRRLSLPEGKPQRLSLVEKPLTR
jgi:hypothetical protein